jgi:UDP-N-acetylglucosamine 4,6-dehydratase/UDP-glucose 4-epimerase
MERSIQDDRLRLFLGDVRDSRRLRRAIEGCEVIFHCAALKIIPSCEYNPTEAIATNILGSQNLIECALETEPEIVMGVSSDKACAPLNLYGATKLCMEKLFTAANLYKGRRRTAFSCVRYGNVLGSNDSVVQLWRDQLRRRQPLSVTNPEMTRFSISINAAVDFVFRSASKARGGEVFVPKLRAYRVKDLADAFIQLGGERVAMSEVGERPGEKRDEVLINEHEMRLAFDDGTDYVILPDPGIRETFGLQYGIERMTALTGFGNPYSSLYADKMSPEELRQLLIKEGELGE